ncbi:MAG: hypothetical protein A6D91_08030 [Bacillaceae bacterium G1]|nr:DNA repair photolyase [Bacillota bacterium]OJF17601.1 MAG: hypothetical protein A6D91_08030 [Bacillaceae bacterium G1]
MFSRIYVEDGARDYPLAQRVLKRFPQAAVIPIRRYMDVFGRPRQQFAVQKQAQQLILAVKRPPFIYPGAPVCHDFGHRHFYYTSVALNCLYNCEYCFLQGMFPSAHLVLFVNVEDYFAEAAQLLQQHPVYLSVSYESDLLAMERIVPYVRAWIEFAARHPNLTVEVRTKSANYAALASIRPLDNVILAWTLSPEAVIGRHEPLTPSLSARLASARQAAEDGWPVRLCFDPLLFVPDWREQYRQCIETTFAAIPAEKVRDISIGLFRVPKDYLKAMRKQRPDSALLHYPYENRHGVLSYPAPVGEEMVQFVRQELEKHVPPEKIYLLDERDV